jgi:hypothetical protein
LGGALMATADAARVSSAPLVNARRRLGRWGRATRLAVGCTLIVLAVAVWDADRLELLIGLVALPTVATLLVWLRPRASSPLRLGAAGHLVTVAHVAVTVSLIPEAAALFYGSMALVAGLHGNRGCEVTAVANWLRDRDDQIGCPMFAPFDELDAHAVRVATASPDAPCPRGRDDPTGCRHWS